MLNQRLLFIFLLISTLLCMQVLGQDYNDTNSTVIPRVVGGDVVTNPDIGGYLVALRYNNTLTCGGTLVHDLIVITAAHCFNDSMKMDKLVAIGGVSTIDETGVRRHIENFIKHDPIEMDVAVLLLDGPMVGNGIGKLKLCKTPLMVGMSLTVVGFGKTSKQGTGPSKYLRKAIVPIVSKEYCTKAYRELSIQITNSMLCASAMGKRDACFIDSGGPLVFQNQLCGIVSFGEGCASIRYPGVYTDVRYARSFIINSFKSLMQKRKRSRNRS
ncbi:seminase-like [Drosophila serrata]|uniref:seminase-like n=1 Tax=Drosophila serrata TaxID=7274 RepID=UPI000A1D0520|nr:seminase-like [Drosophila serrata]